MEEFLERLQIRLDSINILERIYKTHPRMLNTEMAYQIERNKYSKTYFSGSIVYRGDCFTDYILNNKVTPMDELITKFLLNTK